jgi:predicted RND superfamily exporter protein
MGYVAVIGIGASMFAAIIVLPAIFSMMRNKRISL